MKTIINSIPIIGVLGVLFSFYLFKRYPGMSAEAANSYFLICLSFIAFGVVRSMLKKGSGRKPSVGNSKGIFAVLGGIVAVIIGILGIASIASQSNNEDKKRRESIRQQGMVNQVRNQTKYTYRSTPSQAPQATSQRAKSNYVDPSQDRRIMRDQLREERSQAKWENDNRAAAQESRNEGRD